MADPSYNVDDILKEVRKRREENETKVKETKVNDVINEPIKKVVENNEVKAFVKNTKEEIEKQKAEDQTTQRLEFERKKAEQFEAQKAEFERKKAKEIEERRKEAEKRKAEALEKQKKEAEKVEAERRRVPKEELENKNNDKLAEKDGEVDLFELSGDNQNKKNKKKNKKDKKNKKQNIGKDGKKEKFSKTKKGKIVISIIVILAVLIVGGGIFAFIYVNNALDKVSEKQDNKPVTVEEWDGMEKLVENFDPIYEAPRSEITDLSDMAKTWYYTGKPVSSTHVLNILLIGEDTRGDEIEDEGYRADSAIIASVNIDTGKITLTSILRDTYAYFELEEGNKESGTYDKINAAMSRGNLDCYIRTIENNFKINIDNYVLVNFASFKTIIDTLGGVDIEIKEREIKEINNHQARYGNVTIKKTFEGDKGVLHLNGEQALAYSRIRYIDGDDVRANRQKTVLSELFKKAKSSSNVKLVELVTKLLPYVKTGASKQEILDMGTYALKHGWINYELQTFNVPENFTDSEGVQHKAAIGGRYKGNSKVKDWKWRVDFPLSAKRVQENIYGKTSIVLNENRPNFEKLS